MIEKVSELYPNSAIEERVKTPPNEHVQEPVKQSSKEPAKEHRREIQKHKINKSENDPIISVDNKQQRKKSDSSYKLIEQENSNQKEKSNEKDNNNQTKSTEQSRKQSQFSVVESTTPSNPDEIKIKPKLDFEQLLELELQKEGISQNNGQEKGKPKKQFLKKGKMINEIYKNEPSYDPKSISPRKKQKSISPERKDEHEL